MELVATSLHEHVEESDWRAVGLFGFVALSIQLSHLLANLSFLVGRIQVGNFTGVQQVVDVFQERLAFDLNKTTTTKNETCDV